MIGVLDSGEGGLSVLKEITRLLPAEKYIYYSDNKYCPYGEKTKEFIVGRMISITEELLRSGVDIIVVACNTATSAAISELRKMYSDKESQEVASRLSSLTSGRRHYVNFIGMEPAVKPAALGTASGVIGVLATAGTLKGSKYLTSKENVDDNVRVVENVGKGFVEIVESGILDGDKVERVVKQSLNPLLDEGADTIVLGCTHYPFLLPVMRRVAGDSVRFIDPAPAVARRLVSVMIQDGLLAEHPISPVDADILQSNDAVNLHSAQSFSLQPRPDIELRASGDPAALNLLFHKIYL